VVEMPGLPVLSPLSSRSPAAVFKTRAESSASSTVEAAAADVSLHFSFHFANHKLGVFIDS